MKLMNSAQSDNLAIPDNKPTIEAIQANLQNTPGGFDFLEKIVGEQLKTPQRIADDIGAAEKVAQSKPIEEPKKEAVKVEVKPAIPPTPQPEAKKETLPPEPETPPVESPLDSKEENFKNIRKKLGETTSTLKEKEAALQAAQERIKKYETGEEFPEVIKEKEKKIEELSKYERIVALRTSDAYKQKFLRPLESIKSKLSAIAKDYDIPEEEVHKALEIKSVRELNSFLSDHFDPVGAMDVKQLINQAQGLTEDAKKAEAEPETALQEIERESAKAREIIRTEEIGKIVARSKQAWVNSLNKIREEGKVKELIPSEIDDEFNTNVVSPIQEASAKEYSKIVKALADAGLKELPEGVDFALARMVQLAIASSFAVDSRDKAMREAEELRTNSTRNNSYIRPLSVGSVPSNGTSTESRRISETPEQAAEAVVNKVLAGGK